MHPQPLLVIAKSDRKGSLSMTVTSAPSRTPEETTFPESLQTTDPYRSQSLLEIEQEQPDSMSRQSSESSDTSPPLPSPPLCSHTMSGTATPDSVGAPGLKVPKPKEFD